MKLSSEAELFEAIRRGDVETVLGMLERDAGLASCRDGRGLTPLHAAAEGGGLPLPEHTEIARVLLERGADPEAAAPHERLGAVPVLVYAAYCSHRNEPLVRLLLERGCDPESRSSAGLTAMLAAAMRGSREICDALRERGASACVHSLAALGLTGDLRRVLRQDPDLANSRDEFQRATPLYFAALQDRREAAALLLDFDARLSAEDRRGNTAVHAAAAVGARRTLEFLLERGADVNTRNHDLQTPLHWALEEWNCEGSEVVRLLIAWGADVNARDASRQTPLGKALAANKTHLVELLRSHRARL